MLTNPKDTVPFQIERMEHLLPFAAAAVVAAASAQVSLEGCAGVDTQNGDVRPMLASAVTVLPDGPGWVYEFKWDGIRALVDVSASGVAVASRTGRDVTATYPELAGLADGVADALVDGEIVAIRDGRPSFELLQSRMNVRSATDARRLATVTPVTFVAFDLLRRYGVDLTARPYAERRATLERWIAEQPGWAISPAFDDGPATEAAAREHGLEGVMAKRADSIYRPGVRGPDWVKLRFTRAGDFVVVGWEAPQDAPEVLSSLVLAAGSPGALRFCGKVGSGLTAAQARALQRALVPRPTPAVEPIPPPSPGRVAQWVEPRTVVEVSYTERTDDGRLRHPVFARVRTDKTVEDVDGG